MPAATPPGRGKWPRGKKTPARKQELLRIAAVCERVPARAPRDFWEALQHYWFIHLGVISEANPWDAFNPGRLDQHLLPFYRRGLADGSLSREKARELLQAFWIKFNNHPSPPKVGVTAEESGTYTDFALINTGGVDPEGADGVNEVSFLILEVIEEMRLLQPSSMVQISKKNPDAFLHRALEIVRTGFGQPSLFNSEAIVAELLRQGKSLADARRGGASGCVETGAFGRESYILTGYFNLVKVLEITLNNGRDPLSGKMIGLETGDPEKFASFADLLAAFEKQLRHFIDIKVRGSNVIDRLYARDLPVPFLSLLIDDCIASGRDYHDGGARYNTSYIQGVGLGTISDALSAIRHHVFSAGDLAMGAAAADAARRFPRRREDCGSCCRTRRRATATTTTRPTTSPARCSRCISAPWTAGPTCAAAATASTCCPPPSTSTSAKRPAPRPTGAGPGSRSPRGSRRSRAPTARGRPRCSSRRPRSTTCAPAARCSTRSSRRSSSPGDDGIVRLGQLVRTYFRHERPPPAVQRGRRRHPARRPKPPRKIPRPDRARGRLQRLLRRPRLRPAGRDHQPDRAPGVRLIKHCSVICNS